MIAVAALAGADSMARTVPLPAEALSYTVMVQAAAAGWSIIAVKRAGAAQTVRV
jgi:hypothetical protein